MIIQGPLKDGIYLEFKKKYLNDLQEFCKNIWKKAKKNKIQKNAKIQYIKLSLYLDEKNPNLFVLRDDNSYSIFKQSREENYYKLPINYRISLFKNTSIHDDYFNFFEEKEKTDLHIDVIFSNNFFLVKTFKDENHKSQYIPSDINLRGKSDFLFKIRNISSEEISSYREKLNLNNFKKEIIDFLQKLPDNSTSLLYYSNKDSEEMNPHQKLDFRLLLKEADPNLKKRMIIVFKKLEIKILKHIYYALSLKEIRKTSSKFYIHKNKNHAVLSYYRSGFNREEPIAYINMSK